MTVTKFLFYAAVGLVLGLALTLATAILIANAKGNTLYEYYNGKLPSIEERAVEAARFGIWQYRGTRDQNIRLLGELEKERDLLGIQVISRYRTTLSSSITSSVATIPVSSVQTFDGHTIVQADIGTKVFLTLEPGGTKEEIVMCTGISGNSWTGCTRGLSFYGTTTTAVAANQKSHITGSIVVMSNVHYVYAEKVDVSDNEQIAGLKIFSTYPQIASYSVPTDNNEFVPKKYVDDSTTAGAPDATETAKGLVEVANRQDIAQWTTNGSTGAKLAIPAFAATSTYSGVATTSVVATKSTGKLDPKLFQTENVGWTGDNVFAASTTFSKDLNASATTTLTGRVLSNSNLAAMTAAEQINGFSLPVPVYASSTGKAAKCDANDDLTGYTFLGFAMTSAATNGTVYVQTTGIVPGFTGLTAGTDYYVSNTVGTIGTSAGTVPMKVGRAISATQLAIDYQVTSGPLVEFSSNATTTAIVDTFVQCYCHNFSNDLQLYINGLMVQSDGGTYSNISALVPKGSNYQCEDDASTSATACKNYYYFYN